MCSIGKVSIILPTHKGRNLSGVLDAIDKSTYRNVEIIVVNVGKERSAQRNIGINKATGEYLLILDSDMHITPNLLEDCIGKIQYCDGVYLREEIKTSGLFGKIRSWERQFYTGTAIDCVRFIRRKGCPYFDEGLSGPEDAAWDREVGGTRTVSNYPYLHYEDVTFVSYFKKKAYYSRSMKLFADRYPNDKVLNFKYRCWTVFTENGKWKQLFNLPMTLAVILIILVRGVIYLCFRER